jgi:beta-glucosidase
MIFKISQTLKTPLHLMTQGVLGRFSVKAADIHAQDGLLKKIHTLASVTISFVGMVISTPFWMLGEVLEVCTKDGRDQFQDAVEFTGEGVDLKAPFLDPSKTEMIGTGTSTFQSTSDPDFCIDSCVHNALKDPSLGLGNGVDILTVEGRNLTIKFLEKMKANTFRFSVEWKDVINSKGFNRYVEAAKHFHKAGFELVITLDHWIGNGTKDVFEKEGDEEEFIEYAKSAYTALRPYASHFLTFNEINVDAAQKYVMGDLPPTRVCRFWAAHKLTALKLQAHSKVYDALHVLEKTYIGEKKEGGLQVGLSHQAIVMRSNSRWNIVARIAAHVMTYLFHESFMQRAEQMTDKLDFLGVQYYTRPLLGRDGWNPVDSIAEINRHNPDVWMVKGMRYRFDPQGILPILREINARINRPKATKEIPFIVTEIGSAGKIKKEGKNALDSSEHRKAEYNKIALAGMRAAQNEGIPLIGALFWTLFDNLEWQHGFEEGTAFGQLATTITREQDGSKTIKAEETEGFQVIVESFLKTDSERKGAEASVASF